MGRSLTSAPVLFGRYFSSSSFVLRCLRVSSATAISALALLAAAGSAGAHDHPAYDHDPGVKVANTDWMSQIPGTTPLSRLNIPGTHDTMSLAGGVIGLVAQTQSLVLADQLESGIRALDIRLAHSNDAFLLAHGAVLLGTEFGADVLDVAIAFLAAHPRETILMRFKEDQTAQSAEEFYERLNIYLDGRGRQNFWVPVSGLNDNPTLDQIRGKIVLLDNKYNATNAAGTLTPYGLKYPDAFDVQDQYEVGILYDKWSLAKGQIYAANAAPSDSSTIFLNYLSAIATLPPPYGIPYTPFFIASGHITPGTDSDRLWTGSFASGSYNPYPDFPVLVSPLCFPISIIPPRLSCPVYNEGTNVLADDFIGCATCGIQHVGIVMSDFPGPGLIDAIVGLNPQDGIAPTAAPTQFPTANVAGWNNTDVAVAWNWTDNEGGSGIDPANCTASSSTSTEGDNLTLFASCTDLAGNVGDASYTVKVDKSAPVLGTCPDGGPFVYGSGPQAVGPISADADISGLSGAASVLSGTVDTGSAGIKTFVYVATDNAGNSAGRRCPYTVDPAPLIITADAKSKQYSDPLPTFTVSYDGFVLDDDEGDLSGTLSCTTTATADSGPDTYPITCSGLTSTNYDITYVADTLTVTQEDARAYYTGNLLFWGATSTSGSANVLLAATIKDITAVGGDPDTDPFPGDIRNATVTFVDRGNSNAPISGCIDLAVSLVGGDSKVGTVVCDTTLNIGGSGATQYQIGIVVGGYYADDMSAEDTLINVAKPLTSNFITGGGYLELSSSAGEYAGDIGSKMNGGFNVKYNKKGTRLQGNVNIIVRREGRVYQIKSNSLSSLGVTPSRCRKASAASPCQANFTSKANMKDITDPSSSVGIGGNMTLQMQMTDRGEPGAADSLALTLYDNDGDLLFSSTWNGTRTVESTLAGGNLVVH